jgi:hypothetical protein
MARLPGAMLDGTTTMHALQERKVHVYIERLGEEREVHAYIERLGEKRDRSPCI